MSRGEANSVYIASRGKKNNKSIKIENAWNRNLALKSCPTMRAIDRYKGSVYENLEQGLKEGQGFRSSSEVLIISSLFGILHPNDMIPDYELMMKDRSPSHKSVHSWWDNIFRRYSLSAVLKKCYPGLKNIYCFMSDTSGYVDAVKSLGESFMTYVVHVEKGSTGASTKAWGNGLRLCIEESPASPEDVAQIVVREGCTLLPIKG
jgi:cytoplasmic iron level regulating protein YaaA (DUF328/UPF0246 family)